VRQARVGAEGVLSLALYEVEGGRYTITRKVARGKPVADYLRVQGRFGHLTDAQVAGIQGRVDRRWAWLEKMEAATAEVGA